MDEPTNMRRHEQGFTLIEIMITVAVIGVLAAIAIPMYMRQASKAKSTEAVLQLEKIGRSATQYYAEQGTFPMAVAAVLPGADGTACANKDRMFAPSTQWHADPTWSALEFAIGEKTRFSYHFQATGPTSARAWAVGDFSCTGTPVVYELYLQGRAHGIVEKVLVDPFAKTKPTLPIADSGSGS